MKVIIVGGVAGGASAAARLRRLDEHAEIIMLERGEYISFANCGLPYYIGDVITDKSMLTLQTPESFKDRFNVDVRTFSDAVSIDRSNKIINIVNLKTGEEYTESYDKLILSPGAKPIVPPLNGIDNNKVFTLRNIPDTYAIKEYIGKHNPDSAVIIGGGYIGLEMAENLHHLGIDVTIVEMQNHLVASLDYDMACRVHNYLTEIGINVVLSNGLKEITERGDSLKLTLENGFIDTDMVIMSVGVKPDTNIAAISDIVLNKRGGIVVDKHMQTSDSNIFAVGDAVEIIDFNTHEPAMIPLAGPANKQGRIAADNICGIISEYKGTQGSAIIKLFDMTIAVTGMTENTAKRLNLNYEKVFTLSNSHATYYPDATSISIKTIFDKNTGKILGAQLIGFDGVDKRCDVLSVAIRAGLTYKDLEELELCYAPPYGSAKDPVNFVGYVIENTLDGIVNTHHWHDVEKIKNDKTCTILDVRNQEEFAVGHIEGAVNIPLNTLRANINRLDKNKKLFVNCFSGLRSYIACRILSQNGFECSNLSGWFELYNTVVNNRLV